MANEIPAGNGRLTIMTPARHAAAVTPDNSTDLTTYASALYIGGDGNVSLDTESGETAVVFVGLKAGTVLPVATKRVRSTSTTATNIVALWH